MFDNTIEMFKSKKAINDNDIIIVCKEKPYISSRWGCLLGILGFVIVWPILVAKAKCFIVAINSDCVKIFYIHRKTGAYLKKSEKITKISSISFDDYKKSIIIKTPEVKDDLIFLVNKKYRDYDQEKEIIRLEQFINNRCKL